MVQLLVKERQLKQQQQQQQHLPIPPPVPYEKPEWSDLPKINCSFEIIKNGISLEFIDFPSKEFLVLGTLIVLDLFKCEFEKKTSGICNNSNLKHAGRLPICDIAMEHPVHYNLLIFCLKHNYNNLCIYSLFLDIMLLFSLIVKVKILY